MDLRRGRRCRLGHGRSRGDRTRRDALGLRLDLEFSANLFRGFQLHGGNGGRMNGRSHFSWRRNFPDADFLFDPFYCRGNPRRFFGRPRQRGLLYRRRPHLRGFDLGNRFDFKSWGRFFFRKRRSGSHSFFPDHSPADHGRFAPLLHHPFFPGEINLVLDPLDVRFIEGAVDAFGLQAHLLQKLQEVFIFHLKIFGQIMNPYFRQIIPPPFSASPNSPRRILGTL